MDIISRERWGAKRHAGFGPRPLPTPQTYLHHSATLSPDLAFVDLDRDSLDDDEAAAMRQVEEIGQRRFGGGFSYNVAFFQSGRVYEGCGLGRVGSHTGGRNTTTMGLVLIGDFTRVAPSPALLLSLDAFLREGRREGWLTASRIDGGHRDLKATGCPGDRAYALIPTINARAARPLVTPVLGPEAEMFRLIQTVDTERLYAISGAKVIHLDWDEFLGFIACGLFENPLDSNGNHVPDMALQEEVSKVIAALGRAV